MTLAMPQNVSQDLQRLHREFSARAPVDGRRVPTDYPLVSWTRNIVRGWKCHANGETPSAYTRRDKNNWGLKRSHRRRNTDGKSVPLRPEAASWVMCNSHAQHVRPSVQRCLTCKADHRFTRNPIQLCHVLSNSTSLQKQWRRTGINVASDMYWGMTLGVKGKGKGW